MINLIFKLKERIKNHKYGSALIAAVLIYAGYWGYHQLFPAVAAIQYNTEDAVKTTITVAVSGSGQVQEQNRLDLKPLVTGSGNLTLTAVNVKNGDIVKAGQTIAVIDQKNSAAALSQAKASMLSAQANYNKLIVGATAYDIKTSENSVAQAEQSYKNAQNQLDYVKQTTAQSLNQAQQTLDDIQSLSSIKRDAVVNAIASGLTAAKGALDSENKIISDQDLKPVFSVKDTSILQNLNDTYNQSGPLVSTADASLAIARSYESDANLSQATEDTLSALNMVQSTTNYCYAALQKSITSSSFPQSELDSYKSSMSGQVSSMGSNLSSVKTALQNLKDAITSAQNGMINAQLSAQNSVTSAQNAVQSSYNSWQSAINSLNKLKAPATQQDLDIAKAQLITAEGNYQQALNNYNSNVITAPFDGEIAAVNAQAGDQVSASTIIATLITKQQIAIIPLNEVDVAKLNKSDNAVLTFDAIDSLSLTGKVIDIDTLGTVSQGVVTYNVKISMDTQDARVKPGMSTNVDVITDVKTDVMAVPNSALKSDAIGSYVEILDTAGRPQRVAVQTGIANDIYTEIASGLNVGDKVVTQTINPNAKTTTTNANSGGGGGIRIPGLGGGR